MNKIWEIREKHHKEGVDRQENYRGMSSRRSKMSGYKDKESYEYGYEEGYCDALEAIDDFLEEHFRP